MLDCCIVSRHATRVWLMLFNHAEDETPCEEFELLPDNNRLGDLWHLYVPTARAGHLPVHATLARIQSCAAISPT